ncbi:hypothetical protein [Sphingorhabdus lacus]|jgi:hypothetical protein|uniref:hypothetical protein n=1 Tax=Sphingorhabdus lacus TaxID=392610 RepID=UPI001651B166|nr:hypothetical protein [Sphingorhabdus lacus]
MDINPLLIPILGISCGLLAIFGGVFVKPWFKLKEQRMAVEAEMIAEKAAQYASKQAVLEERVAVLERIITDSGYEVAHAIESLREPPVSRIEKEEV